MIGKINKAPLHSEDGIIVLLGPGRWGTTTPSLCVPVSFNDINKVSALCEIVAMHEHLTPDASLGTHFLNELVEMDILYLALFPGQKNNYFDQTFFDSAPNKLCDLVPNAERWQPVVRVIDTCDVMEVSKSIVLSASALEQEVICYRSL